MSAQHFHAAVAQVAGRDIINNNFAHSPRGCKIWSECTTTHLCRAFKVFTARRLRAIRVELTGAPARMLLTGAALMLSPIATATAAVHGIPVPAWLGVGMILLGVVIYTVSLDRLAVRAKHIGDLARTARAIEAVLQHRVKRPPRAD